jgi:hypothetical protein
MKLDWSKWQQRYIKVAFDFDIPNPIGLLIYRWRARKAVYWWNHNLWFINNLIRKNQNLPYYVFKWDQLVQQEMWMWIRLAKKVNRKKFDDLCQMRGFDGDMKWFLKVFLKEVNLWANK